MYGFVTVWTSMDNGPGWVILLMYGSHDMRHTGFHRLTVVNGTPGFWGVTAAAAVGTFNSSKAYNPPFLWSVPISFRDCKTYTKQQEEGKVTKLP